MKSKIRIYPLIIFATLLFLLNNCQKDDNNPDNPTNDKTMAIFNPNLSYGTMVDRDGNIYKTIKIGNQTWMAENLRTAKYNDGTSIVNVTNNKKWAALSTGAFCSYNNTTNLDTIATFGYLYNWYAVNTGKLAPKGWHIPNDNEWEALANYLGGEGFAGDRLKEMGTKHWYNTNVNATNDIGFTALPGGSCVFDGTFYGIGGDGGWWSITESGNNMAWSRFMFFYYGRCYRGESDEREGLSLRCIQD